MLKWCQFELRIQKKLLKKLYFLIGLIFFSTLDQNQANNRVSPNPIKSYIWCRIVVIIMQKALDLALYVYQWFDVFEWARSSFLTCSLCLA